MILPIAYKRKESQIIYNFGLAFWAQMLHRNYYIKHEIHLYISTMKR